MFAYVMYICVRRIDCVCFYNFPIGFLNYSNVAVFFNTCITKYTFPSSDVNAYFLIFAYRNVRVMVSNVIFNNIAFISALSVEETGVPGENHRNDGSNLQTLPHNVVSNTPRHEQDSNSQR